MPNLYLASTSPRRKQLLLQIGVHFELLDIDVVESRRSGEAPEQYVSRLAREKSLAGADIKQDKPVLGADTIAVLDDQILEKPRSKTDAVSMILSLSGKTHRVMTAVAVIKGDKLKSIINVSAVSFRHISADEAEAYWQTGEPEDKAGAYGIQGLGAVFVTNIEGSYSSVVGLPLLETAELLREFKVPIWQQ